MYTENNLSKLRENKYPVNENIRQCVTKQSCTEENPTVNFSGWVKTILDKNIKIEKEFKDHQKGQIHVQDRNTDHTNNWFHYLTKFKKCKAKFQAIDTKKEGTY